MLKIKLSSLRALSKIKSTNKLIMSTINPKIKKGIVTA